MMLPLCLALSSAEVAAGNPSADAYYNNLIKIGALSGVAYRVQQGDKIVFSSDLGYRNYQTKEALQSDDKFEWGSVSKILVYVSAMQLYEQGKLDFDEDITTYVGNKFLRKLRYPVKVSNLFHHDAGWEEAKPSTVVPTKNFKPDLKQNLIDNEPIQLFEPGTVTGYSNYGVSLLAYIIELVSGISYGEYVQKNIFDRLGMNNTKQGIERWNNREHNPVYGHVLSKSKLTPLSYDGYFIPLFASGTAYGPADELLTFFSQFANPKTVLFNATTLATFVNTSKPFGDHYPGISHGLWDYLITDEVILKRHDGNVPGFTAYASVLPKQGVTTVVMLNTQGANTQGGYIYNFISSQYPAAPINDTISTKIEGKYIMARGYQTGIEGFVIGAKATPITIEIVNDNYILYAGSLRYLQISKNVFFCEISTYIYQTLFFDEETGIIKTQISDLLPVTDEQLSSFRWSHILFNAFVIAHFVYIVGFIVYWLLFLTKCRTILQSKFIITYLMYALSSCCECAVGLMLTLFGRVSISVQYLEVYTGFIATFFVLSGVFTVLGFVLLIFRLRKPIKEYKSFNSDDELDEKPAVDQNGLGICGVIPVFLIGILNIVLSIGIWSIIGCYQALSI